MVNHYYFSNANANATANASAMVMFSHCLYCRRPTNGAGINGAARILEAWTLPKIEDLFTLYRFAWVSGADPVKIKELLAEEGLILNILFEEAIV